MHCRLHDFEIDVQVGRRSGARREISPSPRISRSIASCVHNVAWGLPALVPELVLYYKSLDRRDQDEADLSIALPQFTPKQAGWLYHAIARTRVDHPWLPRLYTDTPEVAG